MIIFKTMIKTDSNIKLFSDVYSEESSFNLYTEQGLCPPSNILPASLSKTKVDQGLQCKEGGCEIRTKIPCPKNITVVNYTICPPCDANACKHISMTSVDFSQISGTIYKTVYIQGNLLVGSHHF